MIDPDHKHTVVRAQNGDPAAFDELVTRFQDLAVGTAFAWLGDIERAREVAQEAFMDAHAHLASLREPAAFSGWFRRIIIKHCDRVTRRKQIDPAAFDAVRSQTSDLNPETIHATQEEAQLLRFAVNALPQGERMVVALHYFAEATGPQISDFLELPISTIKRRLRRARLRLREQGDSLMTITLDKMRPSRSGQFARKIAFFIALRASDRENVTRLLGEEPQLLESVQDWSSEYVDDGVLPWPNKTTPLITAIERGDLEMQTLLLDAGADVNGPCECATGEAPIWAATVLNRVDHATQLLARGANPNATSASGTSALHVAAMRGATEMAKLLLAHGADPKAVSSGVSPFGPRSHGRDVPAAGRTASQWAAANGHRELAAMLDDALDNAEDPHSVSTPSAQSHLDIIHTGIKALDLFAPLVRGGVMRMPFTAGVGMVVLLNELCHRFLSMDTGKAIWTGFTQPPFDFSDWQGDIAEAGLADRVLTSIAGHNASPAQRRSAFNHALDQAEHLRDGGHDVLTIILSTQGFESEVDASLLRLASEATGGSITSIVIAPTTDTPDKWHKPPAPYTGQITFDKARAKQGLFPAIDPRGSFTRDLEPQALDKQHLDIAERVRALLDEYQTTDSELQFLDRETDESLGSAPRLIRFLCQPFFTTEPFTGVSGEYLSSADLLRALEKAIGT